MRRRRAIGVATATLALILGITSAATGTAIATTPALTPFTVNAGPGDQTDPHVSVSLVAYTSNADGTNRIRYYDASTGTDAVVPNGGEDDFLSDISGNAIAFVRVNASSAIYVYDVGAPVAKEAAPSPAANRRNPAIGGSTVAWQDLGFLVSPLESELVVYDRGSGTTTRLTNDTALDRTPAVSPDGLVVVWVKCNTAGTGCDIWKAVSVGTTWTTSSFATAAAGEESAPDSNGALIVYSSTRTGETDVYFQPVGGGAETRLSLPGAQTNPSISGDVIAFDSLGPNGNVDTYAYRISTDTVWRLTDTPANETLNDVWVSPTGLVRVVFQSDATGDLNVHGVSFQLPTTNPVDTIPELISLVRGLNLQQGIANSLDAKLENASKALEKAKAGEKLAACNLIDAFLNEVGAQDGHELTAQQANDLRAAAALVEAGLGCS